MQQREGVRGGAGRRDAVAPAGLQVGGVREAGQVGGPGRGDRGLLVGAAGAHLDHGSPARGGDHAGGARGDRAVVVEDRQDQRLEDHALGEGAADGEDRRAGEEQLALGIAVDVAGEAVRQQPVGRRGGDDPAVQQELDVSGLKLAFVTQAVGMSSGASGWLRRGEVPLSAFEMDCACAYYRDDDVHIL